MSNGLPIGSGCEPLGSGLQNLGLKQWDCVTCVSAYHWWRSTTHGVHDSLANVVAPFQDIDDGTGEPNLKVVEHGGIADADARHQTALKPGAAASPEHL